LASPLYHKEERLIDHFQTWERTSICSTKNGELKKGKKLWLRSFHYACPTARVKHITFFKVSSRSVVAIYISKVTHSIVSIYQVRYRCVRQEKFRGKDCKKLL
jgi:hypothetical protein